jgi:hypothetical protein
MHARPSSAAPADSPPVGIACHAVVEARLSELPRLRDLPSPAPAPALPSRFLRHADEQTVVGLRAVLAAIASHPLPPPSFAGYGVVAAPCRAGRFTAAQSLAMLREGGGVTVTPHVVPQCSLHSLAGAVSVALGMHGPNIGAGGGRHAVAEGLVAALALVAPEASAHAALPGIWFVATAWDDEPALDRTGRPQGGAAPEPRSDDPRADDPLCRGLALALVADVANGMAQPLRLSVRAAAGARPARLHDADALPADARRAGVGGTRGPEAFTAAADIRGLAGALGTPAGAWSLRCPWGDEIRLESPAARGASDPRGRREAA